MTNERKIEIMDTLSELKKEMNKVIGEKLSKVKWARGNVMEIDKMMIQLKGIENGS